MGKIKYLKKIKKSNILKNKHIKSRNPITYPPSPYTPKHWMCRRNPLSMDAISIIGLNYYVLDYNF